MAEIDRCGHCGINFEAFESRHFNDNKIVCVRCHLYLHLSTKQEKPIIKKCSRYDLLDFD